jgi:hypothetical protein
VEVQFVTSRTSVSKALVFAFLAMIVFSASFQAKLGLYYPETSAAGMTSKTIKLIQCRMEPIVLALPVEPILILAVYNPDPEPNRLEETPAAPQPVAISESHWFRPPPTLS